MLRQITEVFTSCNLILMVILLLVSSACADTVVLVTSEGQQQSISGEITDVFGNVIQIRASGRERSIGLSSVIRFSYRQPAAALAATVQKNKGQFLEATRYFDTAIANASAEWLQRELQAEAVTCCLAIGRFQDAVDRIEKIVQTDPRSRHLQLLPIVWEAKLPVEQKIQISADQLLSENEIRRFVAATAFLFDDQHKNEATAVLYELRRKSAYGTINELAECQLWRLYRREPFSQRKIPDHWLATAHRLPPAMRGGPLYVLGRLQAERHLYEQSVASLLWAPLMQHADPYLRTAAAQAAAESLATIGQHKTAQKVRTLHLSK